ncbi:MAG: GNAT family N-acetyltransferase [Candidatus Latescibacteria bacterium]|nr:GNAT family N-acetyltransferase [Candidatus Latescibacterota bacterium]
MKPTGRSSFHFHDPGQLIDGDLEVHLLETRPGAIERGIVPEYKFAMRHLGTGKAIGRISLRTESTPKLMQFGGHIGYEVAPDHRGQRYAARSCKLLLPLAAQHGINPVLITCDPDNWASRRTCELAGGKLVDIIEAEVKPGMFRQACRYHIEL